jgi:hypothetical protein
LLPVLTVVLYVLNTGYGFATRHNSVNGSGKFE